METLLQMPGFLLAMMWGMSEQQKAQRARDKNTIGVRLWGRTDLFFGGCKLAADRVELELEARACLLEHELLIAEARDLLFGRAHADSALLVFDSHTRQLHVTHR